jgi:predicted DCC family thiol-disulfide oxidoreductase YuxK
MSKVRVYYNSACPVCNAGIGAERRRMEACNVDADWIDIHRDPARLEEIGASQEFVRERLHVVDDSGAVRVGAEAIGALWSQTSRLRVLAALLRMPVIRVLAGWAYNVFAAGLYRWNRWRGRW